MSDEVNDNPWGVGNEKSGFKVPRKIYPLPKSMNWGAGNLQVKLKTSLRIATGVAKGTREAIRDIWRNFTCEQGVLELIEDSSLAKNSFASEDRGTPILKMSYSISVNEQGFAGVAASERDLLYAWFTFVQLMHPNNDTVELEYMKLPYVELSDEPDIEMRGIHFCVFPETSFEMLERLLKLSAFMKFSHVVVEFWGMLKFDCLKELAWPQAFGKERVKELLKTVRGMGVNLIPMFNHLGHASASRAMCGRHVVLNQNPKLAPLFEFDGWSWCLSNPHTIELLKNVRAELIEVFGGKKCVDYFHLGCDEAFSFASCDDCSQRDSGELLSTFLNSVNEDLKRYGAKPIIWGDQLLSMDEFKAPYIATGRTTQGAIKDLSRDFIIADWQYHLKEGQEATFNFFVEKGFETWICPWKDYDNILKICESGKKLGLGVLGTTWHSMVESPQLLRNYACFMWGGDPKGYFSNINNISMKLCGSKLEYEAAGWGPKDVYYKNN